MSIEKSLIYKLHSALKNDFWKEFFEAIAEELENEKSKIEEKIIYNDIDQVLEDRLIEICKKFGYIPDLTLNNSLTHLRKETKSIAYRIKNKTTLKGYDIIFKFAERLGYVYNLLYEGTKLVRVENKTEILSALNTVVYSDPFLYYVPELYFDSLVDEIVNLDIGLSLDEVPTWYLDSNITNVVTSHLSIEYIVDRLITEDSIEYSMTPLYLNYLLNGSLYNKKGSDVPHIGCHITSILDNSGIIDNNTTTLPGNIPYTVPIIKLQSTVSKNYIDKSSFITETDLDSGLTIDYSPEWTLDGIENGSSSIVLKNDFKYLVAGNSSRGQIDTANETILNDKIIHLGFGEKDNTTVYDSSYNLYNGTITGNRFRIDGIVSKTIDFDGATKVDIPNVSISNFSQTTNFWFNLKDVVNDLECLFDLDYLKVEYNNLTENLIITITGDLSNTSISYNITDNNKEKDYLCQIEYDTSFNELRLFLDTVLEDTVDTSSIGVITGVKNFIIGYDGVNYYNSILDDFLVIPGFFQNSEKEYIYDYKLGSSYFMGNKIYEIELSEYELYENDMWYIIQGYVKGNTVTEDIVGIGTGSQDVFNNITSFENILEKSFIIRYESNSQEYFAKDDGNGLIIGDRTSGTINYSTGEYTVNTFRDFTINNEISNIGTITVLNTTLDNIDIQPNTYTIKYYISSILYIGIDDGAGNITGTGITSGTINYSTGDISITFVSPTDVSQNILSSYKYRIESIPENGNEISLTYKTSVDIPITEVGIEDSNHNLMCYANFPSVVFGSGNYHLGYQFIIRK